MRTSSLIATMALAVGARAQNYLGFNSGSTKVDMSAKFQADFEAEFNAAKNLEGAPGIFNAVRLYTNIQAYSKTDPIEAFQAAINTDTSILLGIWTSGTDSIENELTAINNAITKFGTKFTDRVIGISIGSEDLYRNSVTGITNKAGVGAQPDVIVKFINAYKNATAGTPLANVPVGHVDTWDVWPNVTNKPVLDAVDWIGVDEYPYYENGKNNNIKNAGYLFDTAYNAAVAAANGKPVWVTETGWPVSGPDWDLAVPSVENAKYYWNEVGCRKLFNQVPTFWYNLRDSNPDNKQKFAITNNLSTKPAFDLSCPKTFETQPTSTAGSSSGSATASGQSASTHSSSSTGATSAGAGSSSTPTGTATTSKSTGAAATQMANVVYAGGAFIAGALALL
jgi:glucan endo-1,3-beta-D-glucosidase